MDSEKINRKQWILNRMIRKNGNQYKPDPEYEFRILGRFAGMAPQDVSGPVAPQQYIWDEKFLKE